MALYETTDGATVDVEEVVGEANDFGETVSIFHLTFPDGTVKELHESVFPGDLKKV